MQVKVTNVKFFTGGGKRWSAVPKRIRHNQNVTLRIPDHWIKIYKLFDLRWHIETLVKCRFITSKDTKVYEWNWEMECEYRKKKYEKLRLKLKLNG